MLRQKPSSDYKAILPPAPNINLVDDSCLPSLPASIATLNKLLKFGIFVQVGWPNVGLATAGPAGHVPMALYSV